MKLKFVVWLIVILSLLLVSSQTVLAADQYRPYLHNPEVPEHPDLKMQGSYQTALWPGAATYSYGIEVPPGRNGLQPSLSISYNSHSTSQRPGIVGTAWALSQNYVWRDADYSFADTSDDKFNLVLNGQSYELVYVPSEGGYHTKIESFLHITKVSGGSNDKGEYWIVKSKDGTAYRFGYNADSELVSNIHNYVVRWSLDTITDTHGNEIYYSYSENPTPNDIGAVYPHKIEYNNEKARAVEFVLESSDRPDKWLVYEQGNKIREARRIKEIVVKANGNLVRKYVLSYITLDTAAKSFPSSIMLFGSDGISSLPPTKFEYNGVSKGWAEDSSWQVPGDAAFGGNRDYGVRLVDFNRDGLIDLTVDGHKTFINTGSGWAETGGWSIPYSTGIVDSDKLDTGVRFVDLNGDGRTDAVRGDKPSRRQSWLNTGTGWTDDTSAWHLPSDAHPIDINEDNYDRGVRLVDLNGDGSVDILLNAGHSSKGDPKAWINNGNGWSDAQSWYPPPDAEFVDSLDNPEDEGTRIDDVNGDGLPDLIRAEFYHKTWLNTGNGWALDDTYAISQINFVRTIDGEDEGVRLADVNGDGLVDLLKGEGSDKRAWINTGAGWTADAAWAIPELASFVTEEDGDNKGVRIADVNGDGLPDLIKAKSSSDSNRKTWINRGSGNYLLKAVTNGFGGKTSIVYGQSTLLDNTGDDNLPDLGFNMWIVDKAVSDNGVVGAQRVLSGTDYSYFDGFYDYGNREFRGFNKVQEIQAGNSITTHWFHQGDALKGREFRTELFNSSSNPFRKTEINWIGTSKDGYNIAQLSSEVNYLYDGSNLEPRVTGTNYSYDAYGNVVSSLQLGEIKTGGDEKNESWQFAYNTDGWIVDRPIRYILSDAKNAKIREVFYRYDDKPYGTSPSKGELTWEEHWLGLEENSVIRYKYDGYGNLVETKNAREFITTYQFGISDPTFTFNEKIVNPAGHIFTYHYDLGTGNMLSETDANGNANSHSYDAFGRIKKSILPYDSEDYPTKEYTYLFDGNAPEGIKVSQREVSGAAGTLDMHYFYDGFGNLVQIRGEAENSKQVVANFYYDELGRLVKLSNPHFAAASAGYTSPNQAVANTSYIYDALSRAVKIENPDRTSKAVGFDRWKITYVDEKGNKKVYSVDAYGQIKEVKEYVGNNYYATEYAYDLAGNIVRVKDAHGNLINYSYDTIGRKVRQDDPDLGTSEYSYDKNGNIVAITDNSGRTTNLEYDKLDRVVKKNADGKTVRLFYDNVKGTLAKAESSDMTVSYDYDNRLRKVKETINIDGMLFTTGWEYDSADRVTKTRMPDGSETAYDYNSQGLVDGIPGILTAVDYNAVSTPFSLSYGNGLMTSYSYDPDNFRIHSIKTGDAQELLYSYDASGNIAGINDKAKGVIESMNYDGLDRLAKWERKSAEEQNQLKFAYDSLGDITSVLSESGGYNYYYGNSPRHSAAKITANDGSGNPGQPPDHNTTNAAIYDDFDDGSINSSIWTESDWSGGVLAEADGALHFETGSSSDRQIRTNANLAEYGSFNLTFKIKADYVHNDKNSGFWLGNLAEGQPGESTGHKGYYWQFHGRTKGFNIGVLYDDKSAGLHGKYDPPNWKQGEWHSIRIEKSGSSIKFFFDDEFVGEDREYASSMNGLYWATGRTWKDPRSGEEAKISVDNFSVSAVGMQAPLSQEISIHDDFDDGILNSSIWLHSGWSGGKLAESDGNLYFETGSSSDQQIRTLANIGAYGNFTLTVRMKIDYVSGDKNSGFWLGNLAEGQPGEGTGHRGYYWQFHGATKGFNIGVRYDEKGKALHGKYDSPKWEQGKWHDLKVERIAGVTRFYFDGALVGIDSTFAPLLNELYWNNGRTWKDPREGEEAKMRIDDFSISSNTDDTAYIDDFSISSTTDVIYEFINLSNTSEVIMYNNETRILSALAEDPDGDVLTYTWLLDGGVVATGQNFTFTPEENENAKHSITFVVDDGKSKTNASFILSVIEAPDCVANSETRLCQLQLGVCSGSSVTCDSKGKWPGCTAATYLSYNSKYEAVEGSCDGLDNDCDGKADEGFGNVDNDNLADCIDKDNDNDDVEDDEDDLIGNETSINFTGDAGDDKKLKIEIKDSEDEKEKAQKVKWVKLNHSDKPLLQFSFNFSKGNIQLRNLSIEKQKNDSKEGFTLVRGLDLKGGTKQVYVDRLVSGSNAVCVKDKEVSRITEVSSGCDSEAESLLTCEAAGAEQTSSDLACRLTSKNNQFQIYGLKHSAVMEACADADLDTYLPVGCSGGLDCNDGNSSISPAAAEVCNGVDDNCNGQVDENRVCNTAPALQGIGNKTVSESGTLSFTVAATDSEGDSLAYNATRLPQGAAFDNATAAFAWTPTFEQSGTYAVTFNVSDGLLSDYEAINITVANTNRAPVFESVGNKTVLENVALSFTVTVTDPDGDPLSQLFVNVPERLASAQFSSSAREFKWTPAFDDSGSYTIWFTASDGQLSTNEFVNVTVVNVNRPSRFENLTNRTALENSSLRFFVNASDPDKDSVAITLAELPAKFSGSATFDGREFALPLGFEDAGSYSVTFSASDGQATVAASVNFTVTNVNRAPSISGVSGNLTVNETETVTAIISATDADGDVLTYSLNDSRFSQPSPGSFEWQTDFSSAGTYAVLATASDGSATAQFEFTATVKNVNRAPRFENVTNQTVLENSTLKFFANATDPDNDWLQFTVEIPPELAAAEFSSGKMEFTWAPTFDDSGNYAAVFAASDGQYSASAEVNVTVLNVNVAPAITNIHGRLVVNETENVTLIINASDHDGDALAYSLNDSRFVQDSPPSSTFRWKTGYEDAGAYRVLATASDGSLTTTAAVTVKVDNANRAPVLSAIWNKTVSENSTLRFTITASDLDSDAVSITVAKPQAAEGLAFDSSTGEVVWTPAFEQAGSYALAVTASDGNLADSEQVNISVLNVNRAPVIMLLLVDPPDLVMGEGEMKTFAADVADADNDAVTVAWKVNGETVSTQPQLEFTPKYNESGEYVIELIVSDYASTTTTNMALTVQDTLECGIGQAKLCPLQLGVCANSLETCAAPGSWLGCAAAAYYSFNRSYQAEEAKLASCDGLDNDCDGTVDEAPICTMRENWMDINGNWRLGDEGFSPVWSKPYAEHTLIAEKNETFSDVEVKVEMSTDSSTPQVGVCARLSQDGKGYCLSPGWGGTRQITLSRFKGYQFNPVQMKAGPHVPVSNGGELYLKLQALGNTLKGKVWPVGGPEPGWQVEATTDVMGEQLSSGFIGYYAYYTNVTFGHYSASLPGEANGGPEEPCSDSDGDGQQDAHCGGTDCNDSNESVYWNAAEACNGADDDCDSQADEGCLLGSGWSVVNGDWAYYGEGRLMPVSYGYGGHPIVVRDGGNFTDALITAVGVNYGGRNELGVCGRLSPDGKGYCLSHGGGGIGYVILRYFDGYPYNPQAMKIGPNIGVELGQPYSFKLLVNGSDIKGKVWLSAGQEPMEWQVQDRSSMFSSGSAGYYSYYTNATFEGLDVNITG